MQLLRPWLEEIRSRRAERALIRQLEYQREEARSHPDSCAEITKSYEQYAAAVLARVGDVRSVDAQWRTLEIGSGAHGLIFFAGLQNGIGVDPLADQYASLFPNWQSRAPTIKAFGESLPFADASFDLVLSDNVVDHAHDPARIVSEAARALRKGGLLYFTVNVHHRFWSAASTMHGLWNGFGVGLEIGPFADHTVHLTPSAARKLVTLRPFTIEARGASARHPGDLAKRLFFKNVRYEVIAIRN